MAYLEIGSGIYHIGDPTTHNGLNCNPYLLIDQGEAVLIDPGSPLDYQTVFDNINSLTGLDSIRYVVLHHQDPDFCAALPLLEQAGLKAQIVTSWRTMTLIQFYGTQLPYYVIEEHQMRLPLRSGRTLTFISTPYLHFPGAFVTYDESTRSLFSSDLFGAFSYNQTLFADESYMAKMLSFHEHYMPSNAILRPVMDILALYDIGMILPQHGSIINRDIARYIDALKTLECGSLLAPVKKDFLQSGGFTMIFREVYQRIASLYPPEDVKEVFDAVPALQFDENNEITGYQQDGNEVWNQIFNEIRDRKGMIWLGVLFPFVEKLSIVYDLVMPAVFNSSFHEIVNENQRLLEVNQALDQTIRSANDRLVRCQITGLYNETFFRSLIVEELEREDWRDLGSLVCIGVDDFAAYQLQYGIQEERTVLNNMAYMLKEEFGANTVYRLDFTEFALYLKGMSKADLIEKMDRFRVRVSESDFFLGDLTICAGLAFADEIDLDSPSYDTTVNQYLDLAFERLRAARVSGRNKICYVGRQEQIRPQKGKVLVVDTDVTNLTLIKTFLEETGIEVLTTDNGIDARDLAASQHPNVIVSEIMLNKLDGFGLRGEILKNSSTMDIETIFLSYKKDDESVERAIKLGVTHYLRKPYLLSELLGIVNRYVRGAVR